MLEKALGHPLKIAWAEGDFLFLFYYFIWGSFFSWRGGGGKEGRDGSQNQSRKCFGSSSERFKFP